MALKEWAVVVWALGQGRQVLLLRKGGLADARSEFRLTANEFFLYPTYEHQQAELLQPQFGKMFPTVAAEAPAAGELCFRHYAVVSDAVQAPSLDRMKRLRRAFVWNDSFLQKRYAYRPELPLHVLLVRTYRLSQPLRVAERPRYAGCRSWVELEESLSTQGALPVLSDEVFERRRQTLMLRLQ
jgi:hypothetical protein